MKQQAARRVHESISICNNKRASENVHAWGATAVTQIIEIGVLFHIFSEAELA
jgi:hypothetical protein